MQEMVVPVASRVETAEQYHPRGYIDAIEMQPDGSMLLLGWAYDPSRPDDVLDVDIVEGTQTLARGRTGEFRQDLKVAGIGDGFCGLSIPLPAGMLADQREHHLHLRLADIDRPITQPMPVSSRRRLGHIDSIEDGVLRGWATSSGGSRSPVEIDIFVDGNLIDRLIVDDGDGDERLHLETSARRPFQWIIPSDFEDGRQHHVAVRIDGLETALPGQTIYCGPSSAVEAFASCLVEVPKWMSSERPYQASIDEYYRVARSVIEDIHADVAIYSGHAPHEFSGLLARQFVRSYIAPLSRMLPRTAASVEFGLDTLTILHTDLMVFVSSIQSGLGRRFLSEQIRSSRPTILLVESPDRAGGLESLDLNRARGWCDDMLGAARSAGLATAWQSTIIDFFFGHPGFVLCFAPHHAMRAEPINGIAWRGADVGK